MLSEFSARISRLLMLVANIPLPGIASAGHTPWGAFLFDRVY